MRFAIIDGKPYLVNNGVAIPVDIVGTNVTLHEDASFITSIAGTFTLAEIRAKFGDVSSYDKPASRKSKSKKPVESHLFDDVPEGTEDVL